MPAVVAFQAKDGSTVLFDVVDGPRDDVVRRGTGHVADMTERAVASFEDVVSGLEAPVRSLLDSLKQASEGVAEVEVRFGLRFRADAGAIISRVGGEANFEVVVHWHRPTEQVAGSG